MRLDDAYANGAYIEGAEAYPPRWQAAAQAYRTALGPRAELGVSYGDSPRQVMDIFHPIGPARGVVVFVHGGYWKAFDHTVWSHLAQGPVDLGWAVAMPGYDLCPDVRISEITRQISTAVQAIAARTKGPIVLTGHSAGGHLVARMLDGAVLADPARGRIERVVPISPLSDLEPLLQTTMNDVLRLDTAEARAESPIHMPRPEAVEVTVCVGADERPAFLEQAEWLAQAWGAGEFIVPGRHHFDVIDALAEKDSPLVHLLCRGDPV